MKTVSLEQADLALCVKEAQHERVTITSGGRPVALLIGIEDMDQEQLGLGGSGTFWELIEERRRERAIGRAELERKAGDG